MKKLLVIFAFVFLFSCEKENDMQTIEETNYSGTWKSDDYHITSKCLNPDILYISIVLEVEQIDSKTVRVRQGLDEWTIINLNQNNQGKASYPLHEGRDDMTRVLSIDFRSDSTFYFEDLTSHQGAECPFIFKGNFQKI